jgi:hypothetical protein
VNDCARQATALLARAKHEDAGDSPERLPRLAPADASSTPRGYGILAQIQPVPPPAAAQARKGAGETTLPPLRVKTTVAESGPAAPPARRPPAAAPAADASDPQHRVIRDEAAPRKAKTEDDEDLLP